MIVLYSADGLKQLISGGASDKILDVQPSNLDPQLLANKESMAFVTDLPDVANLETLSKIKNLNLILPVRSESVESDINDKLSFVNKGISNEGSYILANHNEKTLAQNYVLTSSEMRWKVIDDLGHFARSRGCFNDFSEICMTTASELLTNAFYNGPRDAKGLAIQADRTKDIEIGPKAVSFSYGDDGTHLWMKITDPFGTFSRQSLIDHLLRCVSQSELQVNFGVGGAGIGLLMVFKWASQMLFQFNPNRETTVLVKLLKTKRRKVFELERTILEIIQK